MVSESLINFTLLIVSFGVIFWMVIGWRAMRAHEKLADSLEWIARQNYRKEYDNKEQNLDSSEED